MMPSKLHSILVQIYNNVLDDFFTLRKLYQILIRINGLKYLFAFIILIKESKALHEKRSRSAIKIKFFKFCNRNTA